VTADQLREAAALIETVNARDGLSPDCSICPSYLREAAKELEES